MTLVWSTGVQGLILQIRKQVKPRNLDLSADTFNSSASRSSTSQYLSGYWLVIKSFTTESEDTAIILRGGNVIFVKNFTFSMMNTAFIGSEDDKYFV